MVGLGLRARCLGRPSRAGRDCLQRLARGLWPKASGRRRFVRKEAELVVGPRLHALRRRAVRAAAARAAGRRGGQVPPALGTEADGALDEVAHLALDDSIGDALGDSVLVAADLEGPVPMGAAPPGPTTGPDSCPHPVINCGMGELERGARSATGAESSSPPRGLPVDATFPDKVAFLLSAARGDAFSDVVVEGALDLKRRRLAAAASDDALSDVV
ncbi:unnamed protein product, partial [Prorocentrum cordatum]